MRVRVAAGELGEGGVRAGRRLGRRAEPVVDERAELCSEARVEPVDRASALRLRALWVVIGRFEPLVAAEPLSLAARRAAAG